MSILRTLTQRAPALRSIGPAQKRFSSGEQHYNQPSGHLFGEKPPPAGQSRVREDWELIYYWGMGGSMALAAVLIYYKPDTTLEGWATKQAKARMAEKGETRSDTATVRPAGYEGAGLTNNCGCGLNPQSADCADCTKSDFAGAPNSAPFCYISDNGDQAYGSKCNDGFVFQPIRQGMSSHLACGPVADFKGLGIFSSCGTDKKDFRQSNPVADGHAVCNIDNLGGQTCGTVRKPGFVIKQIAVLPTFLYTTCVPDGKPVVIAHESTTSCGNNNPVNCTTPYANARPVCNKGGDNGFKCDKECLAG